MAAELPDDLEPVKREPAVTALPADLEPASQTPPEPFTAPPEPQTGMTAEAGAAAVARVTDIARTFGQGAREGAGDEPLGFSQENFNWLVKNGIFRLDDKLDSPKAYMQALNESIIYPLAAMLDTATRLPGVLYRGVQAAGVEAGLHRDIVSLPDAFMGSPHAVPIRPDVAAVVRNEIVRDAIDNGLVNRSNHVPYEAGASKGADTTTHIDKSIPSVAELPSGKTFDTATPMKIHEQTEKFVMDRLIAGGMDSDTAYRVAHYEYAEKAEDAWYKAQGIDVNEAEAWWRERASHIQHESTADTPPDLYDKPYPHDSISLAREGPTEAPRPTEGEIARAREILGEGGEFAEFTISPEQERDLESRLAEQYIRTPTEIINRMTGKPMSTEEFLRERERMIDETIGRAPEAANANKRLYIVPDLNTARDLGVIGPPKPNTSNLLPAEAARAAVPDRAMAAARIGDDVLRGPVINGAADKAGNIRLDQIGINADAKDVIREAAKQHDDFNDARAGNVPLDQVESLSSASGIPSSTLSANDGLGRLMHNDAVVRTWLQAFHQASDGIAAKMKEVSVGADPKAIEELREMKLRFAHMQEQVSGLTAEAGRTLAVFREFYENKGQAEAIAKAIADNPGNDTASLKKLADTGAALDKGQLPRYLNDMRKPNFWDKYLFYWVNALISGPITHTKYVLANGAFALYEAGIVTPIAGGIGALRSIAKADLERVYMGEGVARLWGLVAGTPDAMRAAMRAARDNIQVPLPGEVAKNINPVINMRPTVIEGWLGVFIGAPARGAASIHSFFNFLGYRAEIEAQAYRAAAKEGLSPFKDDFWQRRAQLVNDPTEAMMNDAIKNGYHLTFISEQGEFGKAASRLLNARVGPGGMQPLKLIIPFNHIPGNIMRASLEQLPASMLTDSKVRADVMGKNGAVARDTQLARWVAGSALSAMVVNWAINDNLTGFGPSDPTDRAVWLRTHEPYSVKVGGYWYSYNKFGPIGDLMGIIANLTEVGPHVKEGEYAEGAGHVVKAIGRLLEDEVGMQGLKNVMDAMDDPDNKAARFLSGQVASNLPYSSLQRQVASFQDPVLREAKTFVDQLRYQTPFTRQGLFPKRDWLGEPIANPAFHSIIRQRAINPDPIEREVAALRGAFKPAPPQDRIHGVKLTPEFYDQYQALAGPLAHRLLEHAISGPNWQNIPPGLKASAMHTIVEGARQQAQAVMQTAHPELIGAAVQQKLDFISGESARQRPKRAPESLSP